MTSIKAEKREISGKKVKNLRKEGKIPAIIYGAGEKGLMLQILERDFEKVFKQAGESTLVEVEIGNEKRNVLIHDVSFDPIRDTPTHVDFLQVRMDKLIKATVELLFDGESPAVKLGGILVKVLREIEVEALPKDLPHQIRVDISKLVNLGDKLTVADLKLSSGVKIHADSEEVLILVEAPRSEEELKAEEATAGAGIESIEVLTKKEKVAEEGATAEEGKPAKEAGKEETK